MLVWMLLTIGWATPADPSCDLRTVEQASVEGRSEAWRTFLECADDDRVSQALARFKKQPWFGDLLWWTVQAERTGALTRLYALDWGHLGRHCDDPDFLQIFQPVPRRGGSSTALATCQEPSDELRTRVMAWMADDDVWDCDGCHRERALWVHATALAIRLGFAPPGTESALRSRLEKRVRGQARGWPGPRLLIEPFLAAHCPGWSSQAASFGASPGLDTVECDADALAWLGSLTADLPPSIDESFTQSLMRALGSVRMCRSVGEPLVRAYRRGEGDVLDACKAPTPVPTPWMLDEALELDWLVEARKNRNRRSRRNPPDPPFNRLVHTIAVSQPPDVAAEHLLRVWVTLLVDVESWGNLSDSLRIVERRAPGTLKPAAHRVLADHPAWVSGMDREFVRAPGQGLRDVDLGYR